jgi:esterase/lipase superfamily enzyme
MDGRHQRLPSRHLGRPVHLWSFGWWGTPILVFPSASGMAHEWRSGGAIDALAPLLAAGRIKLYCPESNVSETWHAEDHPKWRLQRHEQYNRFILDELVPYIRRDCNSPDIRLGTIGVSLGAMYAANAALKHPEVFEHALCLSGRYGLEDFLDGYFDDTAYFNAPYAYVPNLAGADLERVRRNTSLTLVVGLGPFEGSCVDETLRMSETLRRKGIRHVRDVWGHDSAHQWEWWRRQLVHHLGRLYG